MWYRIAAWDDGTWKRHWGNCFWPWRGSVTQVNTPFNYQPYAVEIDSPTALATPTGLVGLPASYSSALFSVWLYIPDGGGSGLIFSNQTDDSHVIPNPGLFIQINNDGYGSPQVTVEAFDEASAQIVYATYFFAAWSVWVNVMISIDTSSQRLQVYANTISGATLVETLLTPATITWSSSNPIGGLGSQPWHVAVAS
jgi:hypothetical protein